MPPLAAIFVSAAAAASLGAARPSPRIVNGTPTTAYAAVGALLMQDPQDPERYDGLCTGTLIGCRTFLTAAHCVCPESTDNAAACLAQGTTDPAMLHVFFQNGGIQPVESVAIDPDYSFAEHGDAAVVRLTAPAAGILPAPINTTRKVPLGTRGLIIGFGSTGGPPFLSSDYGVKREGRVTTSACSDGIPDAAHVCWTFDGTDASTCSGDSGGPLAVDVGDGPVVGGITSGGLSFDCSAPDEVFDTDVFVVRDWIESQLASDTAGPCGDLPPVGGDGAAVKSTSGALTTSAPDLSFDFTVPAGTKLLRVVLNGQEYGGAGFQRTANDFDLFVKAADSVANDCEDTAPDVYGNCRLESPRPGNWQATASLVDGDGGTVQLTVTTFASDLAGDANCDDRLDAPDLIALAQLIGEPPPCPNADANGDGVMDAADEPLIVQALFR